MGLIIVDTAKRWTDNLVPYSFSGEFKRLTDVGNATAYVQSATGIKFREKLPDDKNWVVFKNGTIQCASKFGMQGGEQAISLKNECAFGAIVHEICHALGLHHEHQRSDREDYVVVHDDQVQTPAGLNKEDFLKANFDIVAKTIATPNGAYDYSSIMHYGPLAGAKSVVPTITVAEKGGNVFRGFEMGQRNGLSPGDIAAIREFYKLPVHGMTITNNTGKTVQYGIWYQHHPEKKGGSMKPEEVVKYSDLAGTSFTVSLYKEDGTLLINQHFVPIDTEVILWYNEDNEAWGLSWTENLVIPATPAKASLSEFTH